MRKQVPELRRVGQTQVQTGPACGERPWLLSAPRPLSQSCRHCGNSPPHPASEHLDLHSSHQEGVLRASCEEEGAPSCSHVTLQQPHTSPACPLLPHPIPLPLETVFLWGWPVAETYLSPPNVGLSEKGNIHLGFDGKAVRTV